MLGFGHPEGPVEGRGELNGTLADRFEKKQ